MASVLGAGVVDRGIELLSIQSGNYTISICCFSAKHAYSLDQCWFFLSCLFCSHFSVFCNMLFLFIFFYFLIFFFCVSVLCFMSPMLPVSLDCLFAIALSIFPIVYLVIRYFTDLTLLSDINLLMCSLH
jgi:hypothetical protein